MCSIAGTGRNASSIGSIGTGAHTRPMRCCSERPTRSKQMWPPSSCRARAQRDVGVQHGDVIWAMERALQQPPNLSLDQSGVECAHRGSTRGRHASSLLESIVVTGCSVMTNREGVLRLCLCCDEGVMRFLLRLCLDNRCEEVSDLV